MDEECGTMEPSIPHILIAEREFLIALDAEYLIKAALDCRISLLRPEQLDQLEAAALADIDLCLLDVPLDATRITARIERLIEARVPLLFTTVGEIHRNGVAGFEIVPVARKPYDGETLVALVRARLRQGRQPREEMDQN
jgi:DNA-binding response OmpR family regulator